MNKRFSTDELPFYTLRIQQKIIYVHRQDTLLVIVGRDDIPPMKILSAKRFSANVSPIRGATTYLKILQMQFPLKNLKTAFLSAFLYKKI